MATNRRGADLEVETRLCPRWGLNTDLGFGVTLGFSFLFCQVSNHPNLVERGRFTWALTCLIFSGHHGLQF